MVTAFRFAFMMTLPAAVEMALLVGLRPEASLEEVVFFTSARAALLVGASVA